MARTKLNPWDTAQPYLLDLGFSQDEIDQMTLDELSELWDDWS